MHYGKYGYTDGVSYFLDLPISVHKDVMGIERRTEALDAAQQQR